MIPEDWEAFKTATSCHVCEKPLEEDKVRDHCHITGSIEVLLTTLVISSYD